MDLELTGTAALAVPTQCRAHLPTAVRIPSSAICRPRPDRRAQCQRRRPSDGHAGFLHASCRAQRTMSTA